MVEFGKGQWDIDHDLIVEMRGLNVYCRCGKDIPMEQYGEHVRFCKMHQTGIVDEFESGLKKGLSPKKVAEIKENLSHSPRSGGGLGD